MSQRYYSLDVFRGATVALMILVNNPGNWGHLYAPLGHASWHGCTPTDLVFPFFLFAVGNAMAFVMPRLENAGTHVFLKKVLKRSLLIFAIGLFLNWVPFVRWSSDGLVFRQWVDPKNPQNGVRILGVLQRIALCYLFASLIIYFFKPKRALAIGVTLLLFYWLLCLLAGAPADPYSMNGFFGNDIDRAILGIPHLYKGEGIPFEPEGIMSTIPSTVQVIFGYLVGDYIRRNGVVSGSKFDKAGDYNPFKMLSTLFVTASLLIFAGFIWDLVFPINKKIWTSSYVLYTTGLAITTLAVLIYIIEIKNKRGAWSKFFDVFGKNPLFIYFLSGFIPRMLSLIRWVDHIDEKGKAIYITPLPWFYEHICKPVSDNLKNGSLLYAILIVLFYWAIGYWLNRKRIYIKV